MEREGALELAVELGYQIQMAGGEIYRVEESIRRLLDAYGLTGEVFAIPNCITASVSGADGETVTRVRRVPDHGTDIEKLEAMNQLCRSLCARPRPVREARGELETALRELRSYPQWVRMAAYFCGAAAFALFFGGSWRDALCAGGCGAAIGAVLWLLDAVGANLFIRTIGGGAVSALLALGLTWVGLGQNVDVITIGALMILVPGVALTNAVRDIMVGDMVSGLSKLAEALLIAAAIALGTGLALGLTQWLGGAV